ncbi:cysteine rich repeat-containing protein [Bdellovibrio sp. HCB209]|uniref:cysteine rich repeat-containing protein n=1 Tax=Bdellovibrio sp. HCB209 TaxID=3394354 RepID=UPI0039B62993
MKSMIALCALLSVMAFSNSSNAQTETSTPSVEMTPPASESAPASGAIKTGPCAKDMDLLCPGVTPGPEMHKCMKDNHKKVSKECKAKMKDMKKAMRGVHEACHEDAEKFCADVKKGKGAMMSCMKDHMDELSQTCKDKMQDMKSKRKHK